MTQEQQNKLRRALYNAKFTTDAEDENPFVGIYFQDLLGIIHNYGQQHPQWIPVEERLPKHKVEDNGLITYEEVLVCLNDGYVTTDCYDDTRKKWLGYNGDVEYWMPTPQPPRKEE